MQDDGLAVMEKAHLRTVAITGGGSGIGQAIARGLADGGLTVIVLGRRRAPLEDTATTHPDRIHCRTLDVADWTACQQVFGQIATEIAPVDALIAASAVYPKGHFLDQDPAAFDASMTINVSGVANSIRAVLPGMLERQFGRIVVLGSQADNNPAPGSLAYSVSKGALHALVKGIAGEISPDHYPDVLINELNPGATRTAMSDGGHPPEAVVPHARALLDLPSGGPSGGFWLNGKRIWLGEGWKRGLMRAVLRR